MKNGIDLTRSRQSLDFGRGFYTTTKRPQAVGWARKKHADLFPAKRAVTNPSILKFSVALEQLAQLESLMFVRGDAFHDAFWSFVHHCRRGTAVAPRTHLHPARATPDDYYDVVCGPLAAVWPPTGRETISDSDQFSFHSPAGVAILNGVIKAGVPGFEIIAV